MTSTNGICSSCVAAVSIGIFQQSKDSPRLRKQSFFKNLNDLARNDPSFLCILYMLARENCKSSVRFGRLAPSPVASVFQHPPIESILDRWATLGRISISPPVTGIFYLVRLPSGWKCASFRDDEAPGEPGHPDVWSGQNGVAAYVAQMWSAHLGRSARRLYEGLERCCYCFPRGRVTFVRQHFKVLNGGDWTPRMRISRARVEQVFGVKGHAEWSFDDHERCLASDAQEVRALLNLTETWPAVS